MSNTDELIPIRERWTTRPGGDDEAATAGALLRAAAKHGPVGDKRLAEIRARLLLDRPPRWSAYHGRRALRQVALAAAVLLFGGVLSAAAMQVVRRATKDTGVSSPPPRGQQKAPRRGDRRRPVNDSPATADVEETAGFLEAVPAPPVASVKDIAAAEPITPPQAAAIPSPAAGAPAPLTARLFSPGRSHRFASMREPTPVAPAAPSARPSPLPSDDPTSSTRNEANTLEPAAIPSSSPGETTRASSPFPIAPRARMTQAPTPSEPSRLAQETRWIASAITKLRQSQPAEALAILDEHRDQLASGALATEAGATRLEALLRLGRNAQALALLDGQRLSAQGTERAMLAARADLRAEKGRLSAAVIDYDLLLAASSRTDEIGERALYRRATCRARTGDAEGARRDFARYLEVFPHGRFAQEARSALASQVP